MLRDMKCYFIIRESFMRLTFLVFVKEPFWQICKMQYKYNIDFQHTTFILK